MNVYHYTKGYAVKSILEEGFIAREGERGFILTKPVTSYVWLTSSNIYPRTALPGVPALPYTMLYNHLGSFKPSINWVELSEVIGGVYRFSFSCNDTRIKKWKFSEERKSLQHKKHISYLETIARKAGDDVNSFYISTSRIELINCKLQKFENNCWVDVLDFDEFGNAANSSNFTVEDVTKLCGMNKVVSMAV
jgi:hypothetical protein